MNFLEQLYYQNLISIWLHLYDHIIEIILKAHIYIDQIVYTTAIVLCTIASFKLSQVSMYFKFLQFRHHSVMWDFVFPKI